jgi:hypothetical protein
MVADHRPVVIYIAFLYIITIKKQADKISLPAACNIAFLHFFKIVRF